MANVSTFAKYLGEQIRLGNIKEERTKELFPKEAEGIEEYLKSKKNEDPNHGFIPVEE